MPTPSDTPVQFCRVCGARCSGRRAFVAVCDSIVAVCDSICFRAEKNGWSRERELAAETRQMSDREIQLEAASAQAAYDRKYHLTDNGELSHLTDEDLTDEGEFE